MYRVVNSWKPYLVRCMWNPSSEGDVRHWRVRGVPFYQRSRPRNWPVMYFQVCK